MTLRPKPKGKARRIPKPEAHADAMPRAPQQFDPHIPIDLLREHPDNANKGADGMVQDSVDAHGFYGAIIVQKRSQGNGAKQYHYIIAGATRYRTAVAKGAHTVPGFWLDVDDTKAAQIRTMDNRAARMALLDESVELRALERIKLDQGSLDGTGYADADFQKLMERVRAQEPAGGGGADPEPPAAARPCHTKHPNYPTLCLLDEGHEGHHLAELRWPALEMTL